MAAPAANVATQAVPHQLSNVDVPFVLLAGVWEQCQRLNLRAAKHAQREISDKLALFLSTHVNRYSGDTHAIMRLLCASVRGGSCSMCVKAARCCCAALISVPAAALTADGPDAQLPAEGGGAGGGAVRGVQGP
jgi:hypothetical protein